MLFDLAGPVSPSRGSGERTPRAPVVWELCEPEDFCDVELRLPAHGAGNGRQRLRDGGGAVGHLQIGDSPGQRIC